MSASNQSFPKRQSLASGSEKRTSEVRQHNVTPVDWLIRLLYTIGNWFQRLYKRAKRQRRDYRKEQCYTVADVDPEDADIIKATNLPILWMVCSPGSPITALVYNIADCYDWYYLNIGALLQREITLATDKEDSVAHLMHRGIALPRAFIFEVIRRQMANICRKGHHKGFIFAEFPSTFSQCRDFSKFINLSPQIYKPTFILYLKFCETIAQENLCLYLRFQVRASKILRRLQPDVHVVATEQFKKFKHEIQHIESFFGDKFRVINTNQSVEEVCKDIMKWVERASVLHNTIPPLFVKIPLPHNI